MVIHNAGMDNQATIDLMVANGRKALAELEKLSQEQIDAICKHCLQEFVKVGEELAKEAVEETGLGSVEYKIMKNCGTPTGVWYAIKGLKTRGIIGHDEKHHLTFVAHPKGIIAGVIPTTNPNMTVLVNGIYALKGANVLMFAPHPRAKISTAHTCEILEKAIQEMGGPANVFQCVDAPNMELTQMMMSAADTVLGTGGPGMVKAAYSSGKPAYGVGAGNSQSIFDPEFGDLSGALDRFLMGNTFDNGIVCACNRCIIAPKSMTADILKLLKEKHVHYIDDPKVVDQIRNVCFPNGFGKLNGDVVGVDVQTLAKLLGIEIPADTVSIGVKLTKTGLDEPLTREKMFPLFTHLECEDFKDGVAMAKANLLAEGAGHSSIVYTSNKELIEYAGVELPVSRLLVDQPGMGCANAFNNNGLMPTSTLGCGSWSGCSISENLGPEHLINISRIAYVYPDNEIPSEDDIWNGDACFDTSVLPRH